MPRGVRELLGVRLAVSTFPDLLRGRRVSLFSDNTGTRVRVDPLPLSAPVRLSGAEAGMRSGSCREWDHTSLMHQIWKSALELRCFLWVLRVPSALNLSDLPSRQEYALCSRLGVFRAPVLSGIFRDPSTWEALSLRNMYA